MGTSGEPRPAETPPAETPPAETPLAGSSPTRPRRILRALAKVAPGVVVLILVIWAGLFFRVLVILPSAAEDDATTGLQAALAELPPLAQADASVLDPDYGPPVATRREVDCAVEPSDQGWFVADHTQSCRLWELEYRVVPAGESAGTAAEQLRGTPAWSEAGSATPRQRDTCTLAAESWVPASENIPVWSREVRMHAVVTTDPDGYRDCVHRQASTGRTLDSRTVTDPATEGQRIDVPEGTELLVIVREVWISTSSLGCLPLPLFCQPATTSVRPPAFE